MMIPKPVVLLLSGGLDSVALLYYLKSIGCNVHCVLFDYGQKHIEELSFARLHCQRTDTPYTTVELSRIKGLFQHSALTDGKGSNIVPNRNAVLIHIACAIAASNGAESVAIGCNKNDQTQFPDCTWDFIEAMNSTLKVAKVGVEVTAPFIGMTKWQIVQEARKHNWPIQETMSCYNGTNCGKCDACKQRKEALK